MLVTRLPGAWRSTENSVTSALRVCGLLGLACIACEMIEAVRKNVAIDWTLKETAQSLRYMNDPPKVLHQGEDRCEHNDPALW